eukprot:2626058-Amphidinium_carterae.1
MLRATTWEHAFCMSAVGQPASATQEYSLTARSFAQTRKHVDLLHESHGRSCCVPRSCGPFRMALPSKRSISDFFSMSIKRSKYSASASVLFTPTNSHKTVLGMGMLCRKCDWCGWCSYSMTGALCPGPWGARQGSARPTTVHMIPRDNAETYAGDQWPKQALSVWQQSLPPDGLRSGCWSTTCAPGHWE